MGSDRTSHGVRQSDVARHAGVSTATVSRVLNGSPLVRGEVRARVEVSIAALGYLPHAGARSLARRRSGTLGAVVPTLENAIFAAGLNAFEAEAREAGYGLVISVSNYDPAQEVAAIRQMVARGVEGLLLVGNDRAEEARDLLAAAGTSHACAWAYDEDAAGPNVGFDNATAMAKVADHLVGLGRRRIAMLAGVQEGNDRARARLEGLQARLDAHGLAPVAVAETRYSIGRAKEAARSLIAARPDSLVCGNDVIAYGVLSAARGAGLSVPDDLAVTGFDDLPLSAEIAPALTTVHVPARRMGRRAATALIAAAAGGPRVTPTRLETHLVVRATTLGGGTSFHRCPSAE